VVGDIPKNTLNDVSTKRERNEDGTFEEGGATDPSPPVYPSILLQCDGALFCPANSCAGGGKNARHRIQNRVLRNSKGQKRFEAHEKSGWRKMNPAAHFIEVQLP